jgi:hypothetical protein
VAEAFERADHAIEAWQLNTVPEEGEEEEEEEGEPVEDNTFLTGRWYIHSDIATWVQGGRHTHCLA